MENILVAGAHGNVGKRIINLLKNSQYFTPIALARKDEYVEDFKKDHVKVVKGDITSDIDHAFHAIDKVIFAAGSGGERLTEVDENGAKNMIKAASKAQVKKFVMLSSMGAEHPEKADQLQDYLKAKHKADEFLKESGLKYTIVRPGHLTNEKGTGKIKLDLKLNEHGHISRDDVAQTLVRALQDDAPKNVTFEILQGETLIGKALSEVQ
ncbi:SDR family oxidoreductase [Gaetbulibacter aestuarii]|uniref:SDR family oxidoreductase n=1 Tax=Gaetbulibacter aestuarii TaxID=1502358 RepID=A0ABW7N143_9FLAO